MGRIRIDRLALQVGGLTASESHSLALQIAALLATPPVQGSSQRIDALQVSVPLPDSPSLDQLASRIVDELLRRFAREAW
jgi:hypothetical protein